MTNLHNGHFNIRGEHSIVFIEVCNLFHVWGYDLVKKVYPQLHQLRYRRLHDFGMVSRLMLIRLIWPREMMLREMSQLTLIVVMSPLCQLWSLGQLTLFRERWFREMVQGDGSGRWVLYVNCGDDDPCYESLTSTICTSYII